MMPACLFYLMILIVQSSASIFLAPSTTGSIWRPTSSAPAHPVSIITASPAPTSSVSICRPGVALAQIHTAQIPLRPMPPMDNSCSFNTTDEKIPTIISTLRVPHGEMPVVRLPMQDCRSFEWEQLQEGKVRFEASKLTSDAESTVIVYAHRHFYDDMNHKHQLLTFGPSTWRYRGGGTLEGADIGCDFEYETIYNGSVEKVAVCSGMYGSPRTTPYCAATMTKYTQTTAWRAVEFVLDDTDFDGRYRSWVPEGDSDECGSSSEGAYLSIAVWSFGVVAVVSLLGMSVL